MKRRKAGQGGAEIPNQQAHLIAGLALREGAAWRESVADSAGNRSIAGPRGAMHVPDAAPLCGGRRALHTDHPLAASGTDVLRDAAVAMAIHTTVCLWLCRGQVGGQQPWVGMRGQFTSRPCLKTTNPPPKHPAVSKVTVRRHFDDSAIY